MSKTLTTVLIILQIAVAITVVGTFVYKIVDNFVEEASFENRISQFFSVFSSITVRFILFFIPYFYGVHPSSEGKSNLL